MYYFPPPHDEDDVLLLRTFGAVLAIGALVWIVGFYLLK